MTKALAVILALVVLALGWQSWRMKEASQTIEQQGRGCSSFSYHNPKKKKGVVSHALAVFFYFQQTRQ